MARFSHADLTGVVELLGEACEVEGTEPFPVSFLASLHAFLGPAQATTYADLSRETHTFYDGAQHTERTEDPDVEARYWDFVGECPTLNHREATGDFAAVRMSDVTTPRVWHGLGLYQEYFRPYGFEHIVEAGLPAPAGRHRFIVLFRDTGEPAFSERERDLLELLRPHLVRMHERAELRAQLRAVSAADAETLLTAREQEVLDLAAEGKTNAEIATSLWIAPSTVKKHLENIYGKLGVSGRTAAVTQLRRAR